MKPGEWRHSWPLLLPDGRHYLYEAGASNSIDRQLILASLDSPETSVLTKNASQMEPLLDSTFNESSPSVSPDGKWLAFTSNATGAPAVYLQSLANASLPRIRVSTSGGTFPRWRRDGSELFFMSDERSIMSAVARAAGEWSNANVTELFRAPADTLRYDAGPDGQSVLIGEGSRAVSDSFFRVILGMAIVVS